MLSLRSCTFLPFALRIWSRNTLNWNSARTLFSETTLKISDYEKRRFGDKNFKVNHKKLVFEMRSNNIDAIIRTTKQWMHVMDKRECEVEFVLLQQCLRQIYQNSDSTSSFNFGPTIMRMLHFFNLPDQALQLYYDLQLGNAFRQLSCTIILCDSLFNNGMYEQMYTIIKSNSEEQQKNGKSISRLQIYLLFAATYKLNTPEHFKYAYDVWNNSVKEHQLSQSINFLSMLAINQRQPKMALDILGPNDKHFSSKNVRLLALLECGQFVTLLENIKDITHREKYKNFKLSEDVIYTIEESLPNSNLSPHILMAYHNSLTELEQNGKTSKATIDEILCWPVKIDIKSIKEKKLKSI